MFSGRRAGQPSCHKVREYQVTMLESAGPGDGHQGEGSTETEMWEGYRAVCQIRCSWARKSDGLA